MKTFLESVLDEFPLWNTSPLDCVFILPSKRAGFFLKNLMARKAGAPIFCPEIWSIEDFLEHLSGLRYASPSKLHFSLYETLLEQEGVEKESFYDFSKWGRTLLQDFNEVDRYLVPEKTFFAHLGSLQEIRHWTPDGSSTPMIDKRVRFWKSLESIYRRFRAKLESEGLGYQGQVYRKAAESLEPYLRTQQAKTFVFAGFNALTRAEEEIIRAFLASGRAEIFWDADPYYLDNPIHDAGLFIRKHREGWPELRNNALRGISTSFEAPKQIVITGLPKQVSQAKFCGELLLKLQGTLENTALVLGDESLLNPILHSLPPEIPAANVTMGYPVKDSPTAHLFGDLFELHAGLTPAGWHVPQLLRVLSHPILQPWFVELGFKTAGFATTLLKENRPYLGLADLSVKAMPKAVSQHLLEPAHLPPDGVVRGFTRLLETLKPLYEASGDRVVLEYLQHFHALFNQVLEMCREYPFITDLRSLKLLYDQLLEENRIDFQGEPLEGLQIMGMLESRNLDFETVIITSVNEGILPSGKSNNSFIPYEVKKEFKLPTYKEKDAVYTYHFYRLLQRAQTVYLCYNTEPDVLEGGEPSRFIHQLRTDPLLSEHLTHTLVAPAIGALPERMFSIGKSDELLAVLKDKAGEGFSPTSLSTYIDNPLGFYRKYILGIRDSEEFEETIAANTFGTVIHESLENLYRPLIGQLLTRSLIDQLKKEAPTEIQKAFQKHYLKGAKARGKNLIAKEVMIQYLRRFLDMDADRTSRHQIRILGVETRLTRQVDIPSLPARVLLKGTVDRIEEVDGELRIIDYKSGKVEARDLRVPEWDSLRTDPLKSKAFQVLCYAWLIQGEQPVPQNGFRAGVVSFKNLGAGWQWFGVPDTGRKYREPITPEILEAFEGVLTALLTELFDPAVPFALKETR
ncbi:PD-(D/E)XK nuclease family protein [Robiginitalea marina]|uniref:PD-(D/E)XK nuclease family protein n=1 Tax=Robiginitalea marina TaxID=2954105 RepID=A0ABT1B1C3_9FLAO|nr:PD-(D/E)XK nuclease family protein [Robiginitalea marina]MCO5725774.1 PD-(D/E)XK nuclease family protein [Robiginitalea marina]